MHTVFQLPLDPELSQNLQMLSHRLASASVIEPPSQDIVPHITVLSVERTPAEACLQAISDEVSTHRPFEFEFSCLGIFGGPPRILFLGVPATPDLLDLQMTLFKVVSAAGIGVAPFSVPGRTLFHATLGTLRDSADLSNAVEIWERFDCPSRAQSDSLEVVEYAPARTIRKFQAKQATLASLT